MLIKRKGQLKISAELAWRMVTYAVVALMGAGIVISVVFIYRHIYVTLDNANAVILLKTNTSINVIDVPTFNKTSQILSDKQQATAILPARNIFSYVSSTAIGAPSATSSGR